MQLSAALDFSAYFCLSLCSSLRDCWTGAEVRQISSVKLNMPFFLSMFDRVLAHNARRFTTKNHFNVTNSFQQ